jgi:hypothetical protein
MWCFPAVGKDRELVWLRATRSQHVGVTRITHQAAIRLGLAHSVTEDYQVRLRLSGERKGRESEHHFWGFPQVILSWSQSVPNTAIDSASLVATVVVLTGSAVVAINVAVFAVITLLFLLLLLLYCFCCYYSTIVAADKILRMNNRCLLSNRETTTRITVCNYCTKNVSLKWRPRNKNIVPKLHDGDCHVVF